MPQLFLVFSKAARTFEFFVKRLASAVEWKAAGASRSHEISSKTLRFL